MIVNYYTLRRLALQLDEQLRGASVCEVLSQSRNELIISVEKPSVSPVSGQQNFIVVCCTPSENCLYMMERFSRAKRNSVDLIPQLVGRKIVSVTILPSDRQIAMALDAELQLLIQMFGSKANVLLVDRQNTIIDCFLKGRELKGHALETRDSFRQKKDEETLAAEIRDLGEISCGVGLKKIFPQFGGVLLEELLHRGNIGRSETMDRLSEDEILGLVSTANELTQELESTCEPRIYYDGKSAVAFSTIELKHCRQLEERRFLSLSEAIRTFRGTRKSETTALQEKTNIERGIRKELETISRTLTKISAEANSENRAALYETMGELIKAHLHEIEKGATDVVLDNTLDGSLTAVTIPLDKHLTPARNAERYFEKAKKARTSVSEKHRQKAKLLEEQSALTGMLERVEKISTTGDLEKFTDDHRETLLYLGLVRPTPGKRSAEESVPFRIFRVSGGFVVWAGKSGENNDLLTTRYTKPKDLWFHARAVGGSHVVLKYGSGKGEISKHAIDEAAAIAAFYSKKKNAKLVPVSMCEGKFVRKPKGAPAGTVRIDREKVIFVEPRLPRPE